MVYFKCHLNRPEQPYQVYDENTQRLALRRRLRDDDQWVVPHNLYILATDDIDSRTEHTRQW